MKALIRPLILALLLAFGISNSEAKKSRPIVSIAGKISKLEHGKDRRGKNYWQYQVKTGAGKVVLVRDYKYGSSRKPASVGLREGVQTKAKGFYVNIRIDHESDAKSPVFIIE